MERGKFIKEINNAVFDNGKNNKSYCEDIFNLDIEVDLVYIDTPYIPEKSPDTKRENYSLYVVFLTCVLSSLPRPTSLEGGTRKNSHKTAT